MRVGNAAAEHVQNDIFGEMVLALAPVYLDERFQAERSPHAFDLLRPASPRPRPFDGRDRSTLMCWAGADRMARVASDPRPDCARGLER